MTARSSPDGTKRTPNTADLYLPGYANIDGLGTHQKNSVLFSLGFVSGVTVEKKIKAPFSTLPKC